MNYSPTAPLYEAITRPFSRPRSSHGHNHGRGHGHGHCSKAVQKQLGPIATKYECPLCFNYLLPPIYQCYAGHTLCNDCETKLKKCPTCQRNMPKKKIRSLVLEEIVVGSKFNCRNHLLGCPVKDLKYDQIKHHSSTCLFTEIPYCEQLGINCKEKCFSGNLIAHVKAEHGVVGSTFLYSNSSPSMEIIGSVPNLLSVKDVVFTRFYLVWGNQIFFLKTKYEKNCCSWMVCSVGSSRDGNTADSDFVASIKLSSGSGSSGDSQINSLSWRGLIGTLTTQFGYNKFTFSVPLETLKTYAAVLKDRREVSKSTWTIDVRLKKRNPALTPLPRHMMLQAQTDTESILSNVRPVNGEGNSMNFRSTAVGNEITRTPSLSHTPPVPARLAKSRSSISPCISQ